VIAPLPFVEQVKPGCAMYPIPGVKIVVLDIESNRKLEDNDV